MPRPCWPRSRPLAPPSDWRAGNGPADVGRDRHLRLDRLRPADPGSRSGIFKKNGLDVSIKKIPQKDRHLAIASGDIQCAATTVETWIVWNASGVETRQLFQLDKSYGADGMVVRNDVKAIADLKGKTVAASAPGTAPYFTMAWMLKKNGLSVKDVKVVNMEPNPAAQAFLAGQSGLDAAMTYEPYLSSVREKPDAGKIIATTLDYPMVMDTFGCTPKFIKDNPKAVKALADSYFEALDLIAKEPARSYEIMGADVKQSGESSSSRPRTCAGRTAPRTGSSSPANCRRSRRKPPACCSRPGSSRRCRTSTPIIDASFVQ